MHQSVSDKEARKLQVYDVKVTAAQWSGPDPTLAVCEGRRRQTPLMENRGTHFAVWQSLVCHIRT